MELKNIKTDCVKFIGSVPCKPNKEFGVHCIESDGKICNYYSGSSKKILLIKLGAAGDVIRTTPLLIPIRKKYPGAHLTWLTHFPDLVPNKNDNVNGADCILNYNDKSLSVVRNSDYDVIINLDKDDYACALVKEKGIVSEMFGYTLVNNKPYPVNEMAVPKFLTGVFDDISIANTKSYLEELFEICGFKFNGEEYILPISKSQIEYNVDKTKKVIGLNTGCGGRWTSRLWPFEYWVELIEMLKREDYEIVLLGGPEENDKNISLQNKTGAKYFGVKPLKEFINLMNNVSIVVTAVTMGMHIAIGLKKQLVLINNIFNRNEFELYGRGIIVEPEKKCKCYFRPTCTNEEYKCIEHIYPDDILKHLKNK